jgi:hypothetical protein
MDKNKRTILSRVFALLVIGLLLSSNLPQPTGMARWLGADRAQPASLNGAYIGKVELDYAMPGEYSDPLPPPDPGGEPLPDLGEIGLGLQLTQSESGVEGYVGLEHTLVFTTEHTVRGTAFGPMVTGSFDGTNFSLVSERVSLVSGGKNLMRQFQLIGGLAEGEEKRLVGEYRETLWGYGSQPLTIVGRFTLDWYAPVATDFLYLPLVDRK